MPANTIHDPTEAPKKAERSADENPFVSFNAAFAVHNCFNLSEGGKQAMPVGNQKNVVFLSVRMRAGEKSNNGVQDIILPWLSP